MEVTRTNFQEVLTELDDILKNATFLGIDGEFTGLNSGPDAGAFDTPAQYYTKLRAGSMDFLLVQFGLSVFTFDTQTQKYSQRSYNFYVFPRPLNRAAPDSRFMCQASCISFLATQGFDFNKLFNLGIPYLTTIEEEKLVKRLEERQKARDEAQELIPISDDDRPQIEEICTRIDEFIASDAEELTIDKCNAFIRRLVHQEVRVRWPNKLRVEGKSDCSGPSLVVQRSGTKEEEEQKEIERREREKLEIKQAVGLSLLLRKIADSGKLIVGHNMLLDLCHIIHKFIGPLPESYSEFKSLVHGLFPRILDTKVICQSQQFRENVPSSNLNVLLERVSKSPFKIPEVEFVDGKSYSTLAEKSHEAGYDAYITGICFIALCNYLGSLQKPEIPVVLSDSQLLNPFLNKLLIARLKDYPYITLDGNDPNPSRDHVFHLTFPKDWKHSDISQLFSPFGSVYISWLSDTSAYVALNRREQAAGVIKALWRGTTYRIQKYAKYQASLETNVNTGERKRKLSSSEPASTKKEENSEPTNGVKTTQGDDGWEVATVHTRCNDMESENQDFTMIEENGAGSGRANRTPELLKDLCTNLDPPVYKMRSGLHSRNHEDQYSEGIGTTPLRGSQDRVPRLRLLNNDFYTDGPSTSTNLAADDPHQSKEDQPWHRICNYSSTLRPTSENSQIHPVFISREICSEDRFVPKRNKYSLEAANYLLRKKATTSPEDNEIDVIAQLDTLLLNSQRKCMHQAMVQENVIPGLSQKKVLRGCHLSMKNKLPGNLAGQPASMWDEKCDESAMWKSKPRKKPLIQIVDSILDMPGFQAPPTSRYNLIDWSSKNVIASAIKDMVTFYDASACASMDSLDNVEIANVSTVKWNNAGDKLVICTVSSVIKLYNVEVQKVVWTTKCKSEALFAIPCYVRCVCWSHDDQHIVTGCRGLITIYSAATGRVVNSVLAHTTRVLALTFSSNYRYLASSASDSTVRIFLWPTLAPSLDITYIHPVKTLAWHPYQSGLLCIGGGMGDGSLSLWNMNELDVVSYRCVNFYAGVENLAWNKLSGELVVHWSYSDGDKRYTVMPVLASLDRIVDRLPVEKETRVNYIVWNHDHTILAVQSSEFLSMWNFFGNEYQYRQKNRKRREVRENTGSMNFKEFGHFKIR